MTYVRFGRSHLHPMGQLTNTSRSDGAPDPDGTLKATVRIKIRHYLNLYLNRPDPIDFIPLSWWTVQGACMTSLLGCFSYMLTVKHRLWQMSCQRNRTSFVSFELRVSLISRVLLVWLCRKYRPCGFQSPWTTHLGLSYRFLVSSVRVVPYASDSFPRTFSSTFCLSGPCWVYILSFHWLLCSSYFLFIMNR